MGLMMRRPELYRAGSLMVLATCLTAGVLLVGCGEERNQEPTVVISASSLSVIEGDEVTIDGSQSSDPDGDPLRFYWEFQAPEGSAVAELDPRDQIISFVADKPGTYTVSLSVSDGEYRSASKSVTIEAAVFVAEEGSPLANAGADRTVEVDTEVRLDGSASVDPDGDALTYAWTINQAPLGSSAALSDATVVDPRFTPDMVGEYRVGLKVSDGQHTSREAHVTITAVEEIEENLGPIADAGENQNGAVGTRVDLDGSNSSHLNGGDEVLSYFWSFDVQPQQSGAIAINRPFSANAWFVPDAEGTYVVRLEVRDSQENLATDTATILVERLPSEACLMISEYIQGSAQNKAVELYNCGDSAIDLTRFRFCIFSNDESTSCSYDAAITRSDASHPDGAETLSAGNVLTICEGRMDAYDPANCDRYEGTYLSNLTGDDRFLVYEDTDMSASYTGVDLVVDAFGETRVQPESEPWKGKSFQRCNFELYDGRSPFVIKDYFNIRSINFFNDFNVAPSEGCD